MSKRAEPGRTSSQGRAEGPIVAVEEARDLYPGKWVAMEITEFDEHHRSKFGIVRFARKSRKRLNDELFKLGKPSDWLPNGRTLLIFYTTPEDDPRLASLFGPDWYKTTADT